METLVKQKKEARKPRKVLVGPSQYKVTRPVIGKSIQPKTKLGELALRLNEQTVISMLSVSATSAYVYGLTEASAPNLQFTSVPPGMSSSVEKLQSAYDAFLTQFATFQGKASVWINTQQDTGTASIFSQLVSIPTTLGNINGQVLSDFTLLNGLTPGSTAYDNQLNALEQLINAELPAINSLISSMDDLGTNLNNAADSLINSTRNGVLSELTAAYASDIQALNAAIDSANKKINKDNDKIIGEGTGAAVSAGVGLVGLLNFWNPFGWAMMAGGAVGAYYAIIEIEKLKAEIADLNAQINEDTHWVSKDQAAASLVSSFALQLGGFASLNSAAQEELQTLENLYTTLAQDISEAISDLQANELDEAKTEWNAIVEAGSVLEDLTAFIWPSPAMLSAPSSFSVVGADIYSIAMSGKMYHYTESTNAWSDMGVTALSCAGSGSTLVTIDGAPIDGAKITTTPKISTYKVKRYDLSEKTWSTISDFAVAAVAVGGDDIYAISQLVSDRNVYKYSGSGNTWTPLAKLPGPDAAIDIAVANGIVFALANNSQIVYRYETSGGGSWKALTSFKCNSIVANGNKLAIIATNNDVYTYDPTLDSTPEKTRSGILRVAPLTNGDQYWIELDQTLWLYVPTPPATWTGVADNVTGVFASDTDDVYFSTNVGDVYAVDLAGNTRKLPAIDTEK